jgi:hypothetical protein
MALVSNKAVNIVPAAKSVVKKVAAAKATKAKPAAKAAATKKADKAKAAAAAAKAAEKEEAQAARALENEETRRNAAIERITDAAGKASYQQSRMNIFIQKLQGRIERSAARVAGLVEAEKERQAAALAKYPTLKQLKVNGKELEAAAAIVEVEIPEKDLPAYITNISDGE